MNHLSESLLNEFLDDELPVADRATVEAHVAECSECRMRVEELRGLFVELKQLADELPAHDLSSLALTSLPRRRLGFGLRLVLAAQAGLALGVLISICRISWMYFTGFEQSLRVLTWLSHPTIKLPSIDLSLPSLSAYRTPFPASALIITLIVVAAFWWAGNRSLLRDER
jgi:predicted anti-sigma-YlaC factor YlaD